MKNDLKDVRLTLANLSGTVSNGGTRILTKVLEGKVAIVTGGAGGIGSAVSRAMAEAGAKVVVNDAGAELDGTGKSSGPADKVVEEIRGQGGTAIANYDTGFSFEGGKRLFKRQWTTSEA